MAIKEHFLPQIAESGMHSGSSQLDQELDVSMLLHKVIKEGVAYLHVVIDKHRRPKQISDERKRTFIPFCKNGMPLLSDVITGNKTSTRRLATNLDTTDF